MTPTQAPAPASVKKPGALDFGPDSPAPSATPAPAAAKSRPLDFSDVPPARAPAPAPAAPRSSLKAPAPLDFGTLPPVPAKPVVPAAPVHRTPAPLDFSNVPTPPEKPKKAAAPVAVFGTDLSPTEERAIARAKADFGPLFDRKAHQITNFIKQLLPFRLDQLNGWGDSALADQAKVVQDLALLSREFNVLDINALVTEALDAQRPKTSLLGRLMGPKVNVNQFRVRAEAYKIQIRGFLPRLEAVRATFHGLVDRLPTMLAAISAASNVAGESRDAALDTFIQNRRSTLQFAVTQGQTLGPQIEEMRRLVMEQQGTLDQFLQITLPALELAASQGH